MGNDLSIVNAARVSFNKLSSWEEGEYGLESSYIRLADKDVKLLKYLAEHNHWSPFTHTAVSLHWKVPLFLKNQLYKHMIGLNAGEPIGEEMPWNEVSRRYVDYTPEFWYPDYFRVKGNTNKQGSLDEEHELSAHHIGCLKNHTREALNYYTQAISGGIPPEQARAFLPENTYTEWYWTGSIMAWARIYKQRTHAGAQKDLLPLMDELNDIMEELFPVSWEVLVNE
jgi:thymidylate synthase (FAD)